MVDTGYIGFITETGGGQDGDGNPIAAGKATSDFVGCNLKVARKEYKIWVDGQWLDCKYIIYVDKDLIPNDVDLKTVTEVHLQDNQNIDLGIHQIHNKEFTTLTNQIKLEV